MWWIGIKRAYCRFGGCASLSSYNFTKKNYLISKRRSISQLTKKTQNGLFGDARKLLNRAERKLGNIMNIGNIIQHRQPQSSGHFSVGKCAVKHPVGRNVFITD